MNQFNRVGEVTLGRPGIVGRTYSGLNFKFDVKKTITSEMNPGTLIIYNLSAETRRSIQELRTVGIIKVGYSDAVGPMEIFRGYVSSVSTPREGPNLATTLELRDGYEELRSARLSKNYASGANLGTIINDVVGALNLPKAVSTRLLNVANVKVDRNLAFNGTVHDALDDVARLAGVQWSIQSGQLKLLAEDSVDRRLAVVLSPDTGLIGRPERISIDVSKKAAATKVGEKTTKKRLGWRLTSLIQPTVEPGNQVRVESDEADGFFKVVTVNHSGELMGSDWSTVLEVVEV